MNWLRYWWELLYDGTVTCYLTIREFIVYLIHGPDDDNWPGPEGLA